MSTSASDFRFPPDQRQALAAVLDTLLPPSEDGTMPGAGELGLVEALERAVRRTPELEPGILNGLAALAEVAAARGADGFAALPPAERPAALEALSATASAFVPSLVFPTYVAYYQHPRVLEGLGVPPRPPHPLGYPLEEGDLSLLEPVRARRRLYRDA